MKCTVVAGVLLGMAAGNWALVAGEDPPSASEAELTEAQKKLRDTLKKVEDKRKEESVTPAPMFRPAMIPDGRNVPPIAMPMARSNEALLQERLKPLEAQLESLKKEQRSDQNDERIKRLEAQVAMLKQAQRLNAQQQEARLQMGERGFENRRFSGLSRPLGVLLGPIPRGLGRPTDLPADQGILIRSVYPDSPAEKAGLKAGDILTSLGEQKVPNTIDELEKILSQFKPDTLLSAQVFRDGKLETIQGIKLAELPKAPVAPIPAGFGIRIAGGNTIPLDKSFTDVVGEFGGSIRMNGGSPIEMIRGTYAITATKDGKTYRVHAKKDNDRKEIVSVTIKDDKETSVYGAMEKVPKEHQEIVKTILDCVK